MEKRMISFGDGYSKVQIISENNSITHRLSFTSGSSYSTPSSMYFRYQDEVVGNQTDTQGMNVREWNPVTNTLVDTKRFVLTRDGTGGNAAFIAYISGISASNNIFVLTSGDRLYSTAEIDALFTSKSSLIWPGTWLCNNYPCSYSGIYIPSFNKFIAENSISSDGVLRQEDIRPALDFVYDSKEDIGATGFIKASVYDLDEYSTESSDNSLITITRYPDKNSTRSLLSNYSLRAGDTVSWSFDLFADSGMPNGQVTRASILWYNGSSYLSGTTINLTEADKGFWIPYQRELVIPDNCTEFTIAVYRTAGSGTTTFKSAVRNMILNQISRKIKLVAVPVISVNGIRMNTATEQLSGPKDLLKLYEDPTGEVESYEFREYLD